MKKKLLIVCCLIVFGSAKSQSFNNISNYQKFNGFFNFYYDDKADHIYLQVDDLEKEFLYVYSLSNGIGSNDIGLDRGQIGNEQVVYFKKAGNKLLLIQPNLKYRAITENELEKRSIEQAFAKSVLFGFPIIDESRGSYLINITDFLMQDAHGVVDVLKRRKQGNYAIDISKSALALERIKGFPKNVEFDALLTFKGNPEGQQIKSVTPNPKLVTVSQHHSFIELPDAGYQPRAFNPNSGASPFAYYDYATPVESPIVKRFITRHRLEKKNPKAEMSEAVEPIIYYLDNGTPEPVRSALLEGGRWWNEAFEAAGFKDAFQVKILPDDADPLDVRYNVIQWVHRSTRGWSYGNRVVDPRTGEIIKGHVSLGSLRIRQDFLIAQGLMNRPFAESDSNHQQMLEMAIARIRQLSAHEIGHTIGFAHNFAASTNNRASVMDYPHPQFELEGGKIVFKEVYDAGIGDWDKVSVAYAYTQFDNAEQEKEGLKNILKSAWEQGLHYITDQDARPKGGAHAQAHLWDNGESASNELDKLMKIRKIAIANFSEDNIRSEEPYSVLEDVFVPIYFFHRYQTEAAVKLVGGLEYTYKLKGDGLRPVVQVSRENQEQALKAVLKTIAPKNLAVPKEKLSLFPPRSFGYGRTRESFKSKTGVAFDNLSIAETAAAQSLSLLLHSERLNRLVQQKATDENQLGLAEVLKQVLNTTLKTKQEKGYLGEIQKIVNWQVMQHLMAVAANENSYPQVTEQIVFEMMRLKTFLSDRHTDPHAILLKKEIEKFIGNPKGYKHKIKAKAIPDGSPIGMACFH